MTRTKLIPEYLSFNQDYNTINTDVLESTSRSYDDTIDQYYIQIGENENYKAIYNSEDNFITKK